MKLENVKYLFKKYGWVLILVIPLFGFFIISSLTHFGVGISPDSITYLTTADNLKAGNGLKYSNPSGELSPLIHFPPLLPAVLAVGSNSLTFAKTLNIVLFILIVLVSGAFIYRRTKSLFFALSIQILILFSKDFLDIFSMAWSEPLFIFITITGLYLLIEYFYSKRTRYLLIASALLSLAVLTRYVGIIFVVLVPLSIILIARKEKSKSLKIFASVITISLPIGLFFLFTTLTSSGGAIRTFEFNPIETSKIVDAFNTIFYYFIPHSIITGLQRILIVLVFIIFGVLIVETIRSFKLVKEFLIKNHPDVFVMGLFIFTYILGLAGSLSFFDKATPLDYRILSPLYIPFIYILIKLASLVKKEKISWIKYVVVFYLLAFNLITGFKTINHIQSTQRPFSNQIWVESSTINFIKKLDDSYKVYTNSQEAVYFIGEHKNSVILPYRVTSAGNEIRNYKANYQSIIDNSSENDLIVFFTTEFNRSWRFIAADELKKLLNMEPLVEFSDSIIFKLKGKKEITLKPQNVFTRPISYPGSYPVSFVQM